MKATASIRLLAAAVVSSVAMLPQSVLACAACFGKSDGSMAKGMNMGIFTLLIFISFVLAGLASFAVFVARRTARLEAAASMAPVSSAEISQPTQQPPHGTAH